MLTVLCASPSPAAADWLIVPFLGTTFAADSTDVLTPDGLSRHMVLGGSAAWLSDGLLGIEADVAYVPSFFDTSIALGPVTQGNVTTLSGSVIVAVPVSITREGLRPYLTGGVGLLYGTPQGVSPNLAGFFSDDRNLLGINVGGGAIGFITRRTGVRFELRQFRSLVRAGDAFNRDRRSRLSFMRAAVGVVVRY